MQWALLAQVCEQVLEAMSASQYHENPLLLVLPNIPVVIITNHMHLAELPALLRTPSSNVVDVRATGSPDATVVKLANSNSEILPGDPEDTVTSNKIDDKKTCSWCWRWLWPPMPLSWHLWNGILCTPRCQMANHWSLQPGKPRAHWHQRCKHRYSDWSICNCADACPNRIKSVWKPKM